MKLKDHGKFCTKNYRVPSIKSRGFWNGDNPMDKVLWSWAPRSACGTYWEMSKLVSGFETEAAAIDAARTKQQGG